MHNFKRFIQFFTILFLFSSVSVFAQTTSFVYQGKLQDGSQAANGTYQFEFKLFDAAAGGNQIGQTLTGIPATVTNGIFAVNLDFGASGFSAGGTRYLEISVRQSGNGQPYTSLNPRQEITSTPYAIRSLNANQALTADNSLNLGGIAANQYVITTDPRMSDSRTPLPGSGNYVQNTSVLQTGSTNFNISGNGIVGGMVRGNIVDATTKFSINNIRVLHLTGIDNTFLGILAGNVATGSFNAFFGSESGKLNTNGFNNSFFGAYSGRSNLSGANNAFFGANAGLSNTTGGSNSFFGANAGFSNTSGVYNSFFGSGAGQANINGLYNSFFGYQAGYNTTPDPDLGFTNASYNAFFGYQSGYANTSGYYNTFMGASTGKANTTGTSNTFVGYEAGKLNSTACCNSFFGGGAGQNNTIGASNTFIGQLAGSLNNSGDNNTFLGVRAGYSNLSSDYNTFIGRDAGFDSTGGSNTFVGALSGNSNKTGTNNTFLGYSAGAQSGDTSDNTFIGKSAGFFVIDGNNNTMLGSGANSSNGGLVLSFATAIGAGSTVSTSNTIALGRSNGNDKVVVYGLGAAGSTQLCRNASNQIASCSSSRRYKQNIEDFSGGLNIISRLRPVTFEWRADGKTDVGFVAEEVNEVEPLLSVYDDKGQVEGVKYAQVTTALVNAVKEQQTQIEAQTAENQKLQEQIKAQQAQIDQLRALVCAQNPNAALCSEKPAAETVKPSPEQAKPDVKKENE